jgi:hypothetical protein
MPQAVFGYQYNRTRYGKSIERKWEIERKEEEEEEVRKR